MRSRLIIGLALAYLSVFSWNAWAQEGKDSPEPPGTFKPTLVFRLAPMDDLIADLKYLSATAGQEGAADMLEKALKGMTGPDGIAGLDTKKPIGAYASLNAKIDQSQVMVLLPINDQKAFLKMLDTMGNKADEQQDGSYKVSLPNMPVPVLFRFENKYLYATPQFAENFKVPTKDKLPKPEDVLKGTGTLGLAMNIEYLPQQMRKTAISALVLQLGNMKEEPPPDATDKQKELWGAMIDEVSTHLSSVIKDGKTLNLKLNIDRKKHDVSFVLNLTGQPNSALAKNLASLGAEKGIGPALANSKAAMSAYLNLTLPESIRKPLAPVIDELITKAIAEAKPKDKQAAETLLKSLEKTLKAGSFDGGVQMTGPNDSGKYGVVMGMRVADGTSIEKAVKTLVADLPEADRKKVKINAARQGETNIHSVEIDQDEMSKELFGKSQLYLAFRNDALMLSIGETGLEDLKQTLPTKATTGQMLHMEASVGRMAKLMAEKQPNAEKTAKQVFKEKGSDRMAFTISAGKGLEVKFDMKTSILAFFGKMDQ